MNTFLVNVLMKAGCSEKQAAAFERCLEDRPICGVGVSVLVRAVLGAGVSDMAVHVSAIRELQQENANMRKVLMEYEQERNGLAAYR